RTTILLNSTNTIVCRHRQRRGLVSLPDFFALKIRKRPLDQTPSPATKPMPRLSSVMSRFLLLRSLTMKRLQPCHGPSRINKHRSWISVPYLRARTATSWLPTMHPRMLPTTPNNQLNRRSDQVSVVLPQMRLPYSKLVRTLGWVRNKPKQLPLKALKQHSYLLFRHVLNSWNWMAM